MGTGEGGDIIAKFSAEAQQMLGEIGRITSQLERMHKAGTAGTKDQVSGTKDLLQQFRGMDSQIRMITHLGRGLLGVFGIGGGLVGVFNMLSASMDKTRRDAESLGNLTLKMGAAQGAVGKLAGPAGVAAMARLSAKFGVSQEHVAGIYTKFIGEGLDAKAAESQTAAALREAQGGPGAAAREKATAGLYPLVRASQAKEKLEAGGKAALERPASKGAAFNMVSAQQVVLSGAVDDYVARQLGYESFSQQNSWQSLEEQQRGEVARAIARNKARRALGFGPLAVGSRAEREVEQSGYTMEPGVLTQKEQGKLAEDLFAGIGRDLKAVTQDVSAAFRTPR